jgi:hypothetical protein
MSIATLSDIITKVRKLTGTNNSFQLSDGQIIDYINSFYLYDFPAQFRSLKLQDKLTFDTIRGIDTYSFPDEIYSTVQMPVYCAKREIKLFQDPWSFYGVNFNWQIQENITTGDGGDNYTGTLLAVPIIRSTNNNPTVISYPISRVQNILITVNLALGSTLNVTDDGNGNLIGDVNLLGTNTIDYETGAIDVTFSTLVPSGASINVQYNPVTLSIPLSILFFQNQFTLRPVPDKGYTIEMIAYRLPSEALLGSISTTNPNLAGTPELLEWWETLAFGSSKKIFQDRLDTDGMALMDINLKEAYALNETRTYAQLGKQSTATLFKDQLSYNYGSGSFTFGAGGSV